MPQRPELCGAVVDVVAGSFLVGHFDCRVLPQTLDGNFNGTGEGRELEPVLDVLSDQGDIALKNALNYSKITFPSQ